MTEHAPYQELHSTLEEIGQLIQSSSEHNYIFSQVLQESNRTRSEFLQQRDRGLEYIHARNEVMAEAYGGEPASNRYQYLNVMNLMRRRNSGVHSLASSNSAIIFLFREFRKPLTGLVKQVLDAYSKELGHVFTSHDVDNARDDLFNLPVQQQPIHALRIDRIQCKIVILSAGFFLLDDVERRIIRYKEAFGEYRPALYILKRSAPFKSEVQNVHLNALLRQRIYGLREICHPNEMTKNQGQ
jgi:hypothetical protein